MNVKKLLIEVNKIANKLNIAGHNNNKILITDESGSITTSETLSEKLQYLDNVNEDIAESIDKKLDKENHTPNKVLVTDETGEVICSEVSRDDLENLDELKISVEENTEDIEEMKEDLNILNEKKSIIDESAEKVAALEEEVAQAKESITSNTDSISNLVAKVDENTNNIDKNTEDITVLKELMSSGDGESGVDIGNLYTKQGGELVGDVIIKKSTPTYKLDAERENTSSIKWNANKDEDNGLEVVVDGKVVGIFDKNYGLKLFTEDSSFIVGEAKENTFKIPSLIVADVEKCGYTDVAIQNAIDIAKVCGGTVFLPNGEYILQNEVMICSKIKIVGTKDTILKRRNPNMKVFMRADLKETDGEYNGLVDFQIESVTFDAEETTEVTGILCLGHGDNIRVKNCHFRNLFCNWHMIEINGCRNVIVEDCSFINYKGSESVQIDFMLDDTVYPFPCLKDETVCKDIVIRNNRFEKITGVAVGHHSFKEGAMPENITIENNVFEDISDTALTLSDITNYSVLNNKIINCLNGINVRYVRSASNGVSIINNYIDHMNRADEADQQGRGIIIDGMAEGSISNVVIKNNVIKNANRYGITATANNLVVSENTVTNCGLTGVWLYGGESHLTQGNYLRGNNKKEVANHCDLLVGGNSKKQERYSNITNNNIWNFGIASNSFPIMVYQNNFMEIPVVVSGIMTPHSYNNYINGTFKIEGLVK